MHNNININVSGPVQPSSQYKTVVLKGNLPLVQQLTEPNTKYVVKHDFEIGINEIYGNLEFGEASMTIDGVSYHWLIFEAGREDTYTLTDDTCVFIENGHDIIIPSREIHLPQGGQIRIGSTIEGLHQKAYKFHYNGIQIPENVILEFDGGSIDHGTLFGNDTTVFYMTSIEDVLKSTQFIGTWNYIVDKRDNTNGMARIYLKPNQFFGAQLIKENAIYIIQHDFDLEDTEVTIPENCVLVFDGGSISNGTLVGQNTGIEAGLVKIFKTDIAFAGTWKIGKAYPEWFGAIPNDDNVDNSLYIQSAIDFVEAIGGGIVSLEGGNYYALKNTIYMKNRTSLQGKGHCNRETHYVSTLKCLFTNNNSWAIDCKINGTISGVAGDYSASFNDVTYDSLIGKTGGNLSNLIRRWSYSIKNINISSDTPLYGGIRLFNPLYSSIEGVNVTGTIIGIAIRSAWSFVIKDCFIRVCRFGLMFGHDCTTVQTNNVAISAPSDQRSKVSDYILPDIDDNFYPPYIGTLDGGDYLPLTSQQKKAYSCGVGYTYDAFAIHEQLTLEHLQMGIGGVHHSGVYIGTYIENVDMILWDYAKDNSPGDSVTFKGGSGSVNRTRLESYYMYGVLKVGQVIIENFFAGRCYTPSSDMDLSEEEVFDAFKRYVVDLKTATHDSALYYDYWEAGYTNRKKSPYKKFINYPEMIEIDDANNTGSISIGGGGLIENRISLVEALKRLDKFYANNPRWGDYPADAPVIENKNIVFSSNNGNKGLYLLGPIRLKDSVIEFLSNSYSVAPRKSNSFNSYGFGLSGKCYIRINNAGFANYFNILTTWFNIDDDCEVVFSAPNPQLVTNDFKTKINNPMSSHKYIIKVVNDNNGTVVGVATNLRGASTYRPTLTASDKGFEYYDETLGKPIWWNGTAWVDATGTTV